MQLYNIEIQIEPLSGDGVWTSCDDTTKVLLEAPICLGISGTISKTHIKQSGVLVLKKDESLAPLHSSH
jgi:hypothetical protein